MKVRNIRVIYRSGGDTLGYKEQEFSDWYDFADWLKQQNEKGYLISISRWLYVDAQI